MGMFHADIKLMSVKNLMLAKKHIIGIKEIKSIRGNMLVDSGAYMKAEKPARMPLLPYVKIL